MADTTENAAFWLPTHFLTDDNLLSLNTKPTSRRHQPDSFSYLHSSFSSTDDPTKPHNNDDDDDDELLPELTRYLARSSLNHSQKGWGYSTSPQSTLTRFDPWSSNQSGFSTNGSPTEPCTIPSPPLTPFNQNDAAYEAAPLKLNSLSLPRHHLSSLYSHPQARRHVSSVWQQGSEERADCDCFHHQQHRSYGGGVSGWAPQRSRQVHTKRSTQGMTAVFLGGGVKKQSSGTGVFIPRRPYSGTHHNQPEIPTATNTRKKGSGEGCSTVLLPERVVKALNLDVEEMKNGGGANYNNNLKRVLTDYEIMVARRNAVMSMQRRNGRMGGGREGATATMVGRHVFGLPADWTY